MKAEKYNAAKHILQRDAAELIMGYPVETLERYRFGGEGTAYICGENAYAFAPEKAMYSPFFEWVHGGSARSIWLPSDVQTPFFAREEARFHFSCAEEARGQMQQDVRELHFADAEALLAAREKVPEFSVQLRPLDLQALLLSQMWRVFCTWENGEIVSCATAARIRERVYKVQSVMTVRGARRHGHARRAMRAMMHALSGARLLLMYETEAAGALYHSLGFADFADIRLYAQGMR